MSDQTSASIEIAAPADEVMGVIADFEAYPEWIDDMKRVEILTTYDDGWPHTVRITLDHALVKDVYVLECDWVENVASWKLIQGTLLKVMDGSYVLTPHGDSTTVTYNLTVDVNMPMIGMFRRKAEKTIIDGALKGLKRRVEG